MIRVWRLAIADSERAARLVGNCKTPHSRITGILRLLLVPDRPALVDIWQA
jgi:hypothetical protein